MVRKIVIVLIVLIGLGALAGIGYVVWERHTTLGSLKTTPPTLAPDLSKDFGACTLTEKATIVSALGEPARDLQGPDSTGLVHIGSNSELGIKGDQSQTCVYSFETGGTIANGFGGDNGFSVEVYKHVDQRSFDVALEAEYQAEEVPNLGNKAWFITNTGGVTTQYRLILFGRDLKHYSLMISQPSDGVTFTAESALEALTTIAKAIN